LKKQKFLCIIIIKKYQTVYFRKDTVENDTLLIVCIVLGAHLAGALAAFGGGIIAMAGLILLLGPQNLTQYVTLLASVGLLQAVVILAGTYRRIQWRELLLVAAAAGAGLPLGRLLVESAGETAIRLTMGMLLTAAGVINVFFRGSTVRIPAPIAIPVLLVAGAIHGGFACGGTLLIPYARMRFPKRDSFRGTLSAVWAILNASLLSALLITKKADLAVPAPIVLVLFAAVAAATWWGGKIVRHINERRFADLTAILMIVSGAAYLVTSWYNR
jgi:hypothetical protein